LFFLLKGWNLIADACETQTPEPEFYDMLIKKNPKYEICFGFWGPRCALRTVRPKHKYNKKDAYGEY
jgi:hypothetical protein